MDTNSIGLAPRAISGPSQTRQRQAVRCLPLSSPQMQTPIYRYPEIQGSALNTWNPIVLLHNLWIKFKQFFLSAIRGPGEIKRLRQKNDILRAKVVSLVEKLDDARKENSRRERWAAEINQVTRQMVAEHVKIAETFSQEGLNLEEKASEQPPHVVGERNLCTGERTEVENTSRDLPQREK